MLVTFYIIPQFFIHKMGMSDSIWYIQVYFYYGHMVRASSVCKFQGFFFNENFIESRMSALSDWVLDMMQQWFKCTWRYNLYLFPFCWQSFIMLVCWYKFNGVKLQQLKIVWVMTLHVSYNCYFIQVCWRHTWQGWLCNRSSGIKLAALWSHVH